MVRLHVFGISSLGTNKLPCNNIVGFKTLDHSLLQFTPTALDPLDHLLLLDPAWESFLSRKQPSTFCLPCPCLLLGQVLFYFALGLGFGHVVAAATLKVLM